MQKNIRFNESQLIYLVSKARRENSNAGFLYKKSSDTGKWQQRYFLLYQNLMFYFENETSSRPLGVILLEGSYCERIITPLKGKESEKQMTWNNYKVEYIFNITYKAEGQRNYELRTDTESECNAWIDAIRRASYSKVLEQKEELEQKHLHVIQILESERQAKWHYVQQTEELATEVKKLKAELQKFKKDRVSNHTVEDETDEIKKIKKEAPCYLQEVDNEQQVILKVQSFFRGWLCRRRWKQIVELYIRSPHAESMRKRNSIVFSMVECEEEYNQQLSTLVTCFLRPLRMAASSKKPPITHEDVNSIFLNSETLLFLHQIFFKGLCARLENWPTLVLGDLFDMLLPMLCIYQEYVRNHHYSLQVLAEYKQKPEFNNLLKRYEEKPACETRTLEIFLTYPMHQIPRYIITLHELLAHTPHDHVERNSLEYAKSKLEELSKIMHDEVSETENIRKNLSIERMIIEGCDILLDVNQTFVRQGPLLQVFQEKSRTNRGRLPSLTSSKKEEVRQTYLFTNHLLLTTRAKENGRLHLAKNCGKIPLAECTIIEDPGSDIFFFDEDTTSLDSVSSAASSSSQSTLLPLQAEKQVDYNGLDFRLIVDSKSGPQVTIILVASTHIEKAAWCSDISQCIENLHYSDLLNSSMSESSSVTMPQSVRSDPKLFRDDVDIKFSRTLNSCKVPQIRHGSVERLLERLTDLRFLSIDFLNTFLLTYRVFTTGQKVLEALKKVYRSPEGITSSSLDSDLLPNTDTPSDKTVLNAELLGSALQQFTKDPPSEDNKNVIKPRVENLDRIRRISTGCMKVEMMSSVSNDETSALPTQRTSTTTKHVDFLKTLKREDSMDSDDSPSELDSFLDPPKQAPIATCETLCDSEIPDIPAIKMDPSLSEVVMLPSDFGESSTDDFYLLNNKYLMPDVCTGLSLSVSESLDSHVYGLHSVPSSETLTPGTPRPSPATSPLGSPRRSLPQPLTPKSGETSPRRPSTPVKMPEKYSTDLFSSSTTSPLRLGKPKKSSSPVRIPSPIIRSTSPKHSARSPSTSPKLRRAPSPISYSYSSPNIVAPQIKVKHFSSDSDTSTSITPRSSFATHTDGSPPQARAGAVVTSSRASKRRSSSSAATAAFAAATAGSGVYSPDQSSARVQRFLSAGTGATDSRLLKKRESVISTAATMRVLNIIKHWVSKHSQDFDCDNELKVSVIDFLEEMVCNTNLLPAEHKAAASILRTLTKETTEPKIDLTKLLAHPETSSKDTFDSLSALDISEQLTFLDHQIFTSIRSEELLGQAWMKPDKSNKAPHVLLVSKRFNEVSRLVVTEIVSRTNLQERVACIEKWAAIADICRCMHNYNGVLQICAAFVNSSVYRLKKTWEKLSKQTKQMIERLQTLVSSDGRFKNMRDALHRCDPPCIPYLGMYLTDLSFIEEGTPDMTEDNLVNFSKMRMIAHVIREIRLFQQTPYRIEHHPRVTNYLLDTTRLYDDEQTYKASLDIEPKMSRLSMVPQTGSS
ncbi:ras-specific guanine nucleotide-releasing factor 1-like isoform X3 [Ruditapes philippinarum]|uniref:ras-specific guanine nucleotide-releasing factor 1-like isoform X3 n=1 Tax=Ruditapes philippinarum TaxID=129788 RepID=UPI00295A5719|nr:ras-specific guanine nucleotide-releasing factor 1-like isoform X3 [Ruditapes philippinarum]